MRRTRTGGVETVNAGVSGNKGGIQARLQSSVLAQKPAIVFIYIGINDVWHWTLKKKDGAVYGGITRDQYESGAEGPHRQDQGGRAWGRARNPRRSSANTRWNEPAG